MAAAEPADYGLDSPRLVKAMFSRGAWTLAFALALFLINRAEYPGPAARILAVLGIIGLAFLAAGIFMVWSSRVARFQVRDRLLDDLALKGDERVLDLGTGRGLMLIGAAKRLKSGRVTGIDISEEAEAAKENAKREGVAEKVRVDAPGAMKLAYPDNHYDAVVSALAIYRLDYNTRAQAVREMWRVLKPGGRLAVFDPLRAGEYAETLRASGAKDLELSPISFLWCLPTRTLKARK